MEGHYKDYRVVLNDIGCESRDDESFANEDYSGKHQLQKSVLIDAGFNCVTQFPLDYMHLVCLGVIGTLSLATHDGDDNV